ncbi:hypothetical protein RDWZM_004212 [Blomia tropicalis]|uniref:Uncharacterized protein n=1 Tax=Blomia tropicalis TaxID=40697 RepID=A0A9Q0MH83_BLOTA|nr:hypothetical protein RDWZM_004212 [Blomia tropicalis]
MFVIQTNEPPSSSSVSFVCVCADVNEKEEVSEIVNVNLLVLASRFAFTHPNDDEHKKNRRIGTHTSLIEKSIE